MDNQVNLMLHSLAILTSTLILIAAPFAAAQNRTVAITVDDLPYVSGSTPDAKPGKTRADAIRANRKLLSAFRRHHVPVTGMVIQKEIEEIGPDVGTKILKQWVVNGFDLGNHTYSHLDINTLSVDQVKDEIVKGEATIRPVMASVGKRVTYFRFPMNHTGDTPEKHDAIAAFLSQRGYQVATCTIDNSDYLFNASYARMLAADDTASARRLRAAYLDYTSREIDYYAALNKQVFGYEPPQVMLLHDSLLNADMIDQLLALFEEKHYRFVSLSTAQSDPAYRTPDKFVTKYGPMWGYRWAKERGIKVDGTLEPDPPQWVLDYRMKPTSRPR